VYGKKDLYLYPFLIPEFLDTGCAASGVGDRRARFGTRCLRYLESRREYGMSSVGPSQEENPVPLGSRKRVNWSLVLNRGRRVFLLML
jgi:hypothetical protein